MNQQYEIRLVQLTRTSEEVENYKREKRCKLWEELNELYRKFEECKWGSEEWRRLCKEIVEIEHRLGL